MRKAAGAIGCRRPGHDRGRRAHQRVAALGYTYRWSPGINAIRRELDNGNLGRPVHFNGHAWYGYAFDPEVPMTWRYRGGPGSGVLADVGSHIVDTAEMLCGPVVEVSGASFVTAITHRPVPAGATVGHGRVETTGELEAVDNEDVAVFTARFENGAVARSRLPGSPTPSPTASASRCSARVARRPSTCSG